MSEERYQDLHGDNNCIKIPSYERVANSAFFNFQNKLLIHFVFVFEGIIPFKSYFQNRIILETGSLKCIPPHLSYKIGEQVLIMVNSDNQNVAQTFILSINYSNREVGLKILDYPNMALFRVHDIEKSGLNFCFLD